MKLKIVEMSHEGFFIMINGCDLFVLTSLKESFGIVLIGEITYGKPVVTTHNGGSEEIVAIYKSIFR